MKRVLSCDSLKTAYDICLLRKQALNLNLGNFDGVALEVEGDGQTFKLNLKTKDQEDVPECTFQATFDTIAGEEAFPLVPMHCSRDMPCPSPSALDS